MEMRKTLHKFVRTFLMVITALFFSIKILPAAERGNWFAVVGSFRVQSNAVNFAEKLSKNNLRPEIYLAENDYYAVTLGGYLDLKQAKQLVAMAKEKGIADDAYVWKSDVWGENLYKPSEPSMTPASDAQKIIINDIVDALHETVTFSEIIRFSGKTVNVSFRNPTIYPNPPDQTLHIRFDFTYFVQGDYRYKYLGEDSGSGFVVIKSNLTVQDSLLTIKNLKLHHMEKLPYGKRQYSGKSDTTGSAPESDGKLPPEVDRAIQFDWFNTLKKHLENKGFLKVPVDRAKVNVEYKFVLLTSAE
jgi:hypothetical protein